MFDNVTIQSQTYLVHQESVRGRLRELSAYGNVKIQSLYGSWNGVMVKMAVSKGVRLRGNFWWVCAARFSKSWLSVSEQKIVIFHTRFQTWTV